jgi:thiamine biosynthesis protein ThiS
MKVTVNNQIVEFPPGAMLAEVLKLRKQQHPVFAIEHNQDAADKRKLHEIPLHDGDVVNIVSPVGGG